VTAMALSVENVPLSQLVAVTTVDGHKSSIVRDGQITS
jgi:hypothetical protein